MLRTCPRAVGGRGGSHSLHEARGASREHVLSRARQEAAAGPLHPAPGADTRLSSSAAPERGLLGRDCCFQATLAMSEAAALGAEEPPLFMGGRAGSRGGVGHPALLGLCLPTWLRARGWGAERRTWSCREELVSLTASGCRAMPGPPPPPGARLVG